MTDLPYLADMSSTECLDAGLTCSIDPRTGRCTECGIPETTGTGAYGGGQCHYVFDGHDTDGTVFHLCTVHNSIEISPDASCAAAQ